jgi:biopolymer transport protein TolR
MLPKHNKPNIVKEVRSDINVTPLVDVCLVLLIIFMVVTPMLQQGVDVKLPETANPDKMPESQKQLNVAIKADGNVFVGQNWVTADNLKAKFEEEHADNPDKEVMIKADERLKYKQVRALMQTINEAGFSRVGVVTKKDKATGGA